MTKLYPYLLYPLAVVFVLILHSTMLSWGIDLQISTYTPVLFAAACITYLELYFSNLPHWKPNKREVKNDVIYMIFVQTFLPKVLGFIAAIVLLRYAQAENLLISLHWPHDMSVWEQVIIMILIADFFRYWFHYACHNNSYLWKYHAIHHSPKRLYWLNTGKFHPIEKAAQFLFDTLPFLIIGVSEKVLALYFVFYAVNGFFQHSNIKLKFGILNYLISTAELHRWHHSRVEKESNTNYGNNTIIWDILFGTRYFPSQKTVKQLGLQEPDFPLDIMGQLKSPFVSSEK